jgi:hypothetical protein
MPMRRAFPARPRMVNEAVAPGAARDLVASGASLAGIGARFRLSFPRERRYNYVAATRRLRAPQLCNHTDETGGRSAMSGLLSLSAASDRSFNRRGHHNASRRPRESARSRSDAMSQVFALPAKAGIQELQPRQAERVALGPRFRGDGGKEWDRKAMMGKSETRAPRILKKNHLR